VKQGGALGVNHVLTGRYDSTGAAIEGFLDNVAFTGTTIGGFNGGSGNALSGRTGSPTTDPSNDHRAEVVIYNSKLSDADKNLIANNQINKYL